jgi:hypothetical protein
LGENYVLEPFAPDERPIADSMVQTAVEAARCWLLEGVQNAMNRYNAAFSAVDEDAVDEENGPGTGDESSGD